MTDLLLPSAEDTKIESIFDILLTIITLGVNKIIRKFFFAFQGLLNSVQWGPPFALYSGL